MNFYFVKLSCPSNPDLGHFERIVQACTDKKISKFKITNIPNNIYQLKTDDLVVFIISGDTAKKRSYFQNQALSSFKNGIYAIGKPTNISPSTQEFDAEFHPLDNVITREQLYLFPQFADNLGVMTKGSPNQAGLYDIKKEVFYSFLDFADQNEFLGTTKALVEGFDYAGHLEKYASENNILESAKSLKSFVSLSNAISPRDLTNNNQLPNSTAISHKINSFTLLHKSFILMAGISGTGKTRFIREQAEQLGSLNETYQLVPVRPDWHEPSDLLGYVSRLNGKPEYVATDVLKFIVKAWQAILKASFDFDGEKITGNKNNLVSVAPYWLCLDEMNLAPVEQYFADYLSVIETREWAHAGDDVEYTCDALLSKDTIKEVADSLRSVLDLNGTENDALWSHFTEFGISLPFNLIVAGTVNMDETTHGFSRKVLDRALSFDFGEFFPNNFDTFFKPDTQNLTLSYPIWSDGRNLDALASTFDSDGKKSVAFLKAVNTALDNTPFKLAFRALNELLLAVICTQPQTEQALMAVWDDFVMCKVLPRIEGDYDKLAVNAGAGSNNGGEQSTVLSELKKVLAEQMPLIWDGEQRPDLYRENTTPDATGSKTILIGCRSNKKLGWMEQRLSGASFTSFWP